MKQRPIKIDTTRCGYLRFSKKLKDSIASNSRYDCTCIAVELARGAISSEAGGSNFRQESAAVLRAAVAAFAWSF
jgi:hypothetical protein